MTNIAILGFGNLGKTLLKSIQNNPDFSQQFQVKALWNRSFDAFQGQDIPSDITIYKDLKDLLNQLAEIDLVVECAHPTILQQHGLQILEQTNLFASSPTAFADVSFYNEFHNVLKNVKQQCYIALGASVGVWDVIRLDREGLLKTLHVEMKKHPSSFKISDEATKEKLEKAQQEDGEVVVFEGNVKDLNVVAPQNTNTMSIYALTSSSLGFEGCTGRIVADRNLEAHIVQCNIETNIGLKLNLERYNPAGHGLVTGSATVNSFLDSVLNHSKGILHNYFVFC